MSAWRPLRKRTWLDLTPLIDVVFTLLLFVVVTAQFTSDSVLPVTLPTSDLKASQVLPPVVIALTRDGRVSVDSTPAVTAELGAAVLTLLEGHQARAVLLRADAEVPYSAVFEVLAALGKAGIDDVGLAYAPRF